MGRIYEVTVIDYYTDGHEVNLPKKLDINVPDYVESWQIEEYISDEISNLTGFFHEGFFIDKIFGE